MNSYDMDPKDCLDFCHNDFKSLSFSAFENMREKEELVDFKFVFDKISFVAHRVVLAAAIPYFRSVFSSSEAEIMLQEIGLEALECLIKYAYSGKIKITNENVASLLSASKFLQLTEVQDACWEFLEKGLDVSNVGKIHELAEMHVCPKLKDISDVYIRENFEAFSKTDGFLALPFAYLKEIVSRDDIRVSTEEKVFEAVIRWVKVSLSERKELLPELLGSVRMSNLNLDYLIEIISKEELVRLSIPCRDLVEDAKLYHFLPGKRSGLCISTSRPRIYAGKSHSETVGGNSVQYGIYVICMLQSGITVKVLDPKNENWVNLPTYENAGKCVFSATALGRMIYIFTQNTIYRLDLHTLQWHLSCLTQTNVLTPHSLNAPVRDISDSVSVLHKGRIYFFGGGEYPLSPVYCFNPDLNELLKKDEMIRLVKNPGVASLGEQIYIVGGEWDLSPTRCAERYNPETKEWSKISPMLYERSAPGCASLNGKIYVSSGEQKHTGTVEVYDPCTDQWSFISSSKTDLQPSSLIQHNGRFYCLEFTYNHTSKMVIYDPQCDEWKYGPPLKIDEICDRVLLTAEITQTIRRVTETTELVNHIEECIRGLLR